MKDLVPISEIMATNLITLNLEDKLADAKKIFESNSIRHIPIVQDVLHERKIVGMLSYNDVLKVSFADVTQDEKDIQTYVYDVFTIEQVMTKNLFVIPSESTIKSVAEILLKHHFHSLPVVDDGELVGIITTTDLLKYLVNEMC